MGEVAYSEEAASILAPHYDAVRDVFSAYEPKVGNPLSRLTKTKLVVSEDARDSERHFAACREDATAIILAPQAADLPVPTLVAILAHEFGHAADFAYPGSWRLIERGEPAIWHPPTRRHARTVRDWEERDEDQVEWAADAIAMSVTGKHIGYCGPCMLQCFSGGKPRPRGLR